MKTAICLLCVEPFPSHVQFLTNIVGDYTKFMLCDRSKNEYTDGAIQFITLDDDICSAQGYKNSNYCVKKNPSAWDKAFYYFSVVDTSYDYVWFLEDDVFVSSIYAISNIDQKYGIADLLCKGNGMNQDGHIDGWSHWSQIVDKHPLPWYISMICVCRISNALLQKIKEYVENNNTLFFLEAMPNTLAMHHNLTVINPIEFQPIMPNAEIGKRIRQFNTNGKYTWVQTKLDPVEPDHFYHPMKDFSLHDNFRIHY